MNNEELLDYLDRHHVDEVRTQATTLDGPGVGKYLHRDKFFHCLPKGHAISDASLAMDIVGRPHLTLWHSEQEANLGNIYLRPDLSTLISDGTDAKVGHIICDFTNASGQPLSLCPRSTLKRMVKRLADQNLCALATCEIEFFLFKESFDELTKSNYAQLTPLSSTKPGGLYHIRNAFLAKPFMNELIKRIEWKGITWEAWNDEAGSGQIKLNLTPTDPVKMADAVVRVKQTIYEVAQDLGVSASFMPKMTTDTSPQRFNSGMPIHHSLANTKGESVFYDESSMDKQSPLMKQWTAGILASTKGAVSYLCPTINSYRRFEDYSAVTTTQSWGEKNTHTAIKTVSNSAATCRIEHRLGSSDMNPYLALATLFAGGLAGIDGHLKLDEEHKNLDRGLSSSALDLPTNMQHAADSLRQDSILNDAFGTEQIEYWAKTRERELLSYHSEAMADNQEQTTLWEFQRYFESV